MVVSGCELKGVDTSFGVGDTVHSLGDSSHAESAGATWSIEKDEIVLTISLSNLHCLNKQSLKPEIFRHIRHTLLPM